MQASVHEAKTNFSKMLKAVARGERVVITRHGVLAAELVPARRTGMRIGSLKGQLLPPPEAFLAPSRRTSWATAAVELLPTVVGGFRYLHVLQTSATLWPWLRSCSAARSLRMICSGVWCLHFMGLLLAKSGRSGSSHKD
ncbi:MAG: type II toxin-antitoxin system prevent-host-death family antitoxin [Cyanobium sp. PLM2.Bin73]|jgi:prevent-host-death family protein|nr:MAG: type II toxin-antitoxin system prevent-host-death family antitoxin [Cyanobium sp. PLM2.Bin73]